MADTVSNTVIPPAEWPRVTLGGRTYVVKYGMLANYELSKNGTDPAQALNLLRNADDPHNFSYVIDLWRACTAHEFKLANPAQPIPTVEQWIESFESLPVTIMKDSVVPALKGAILKWSAERHAAAAPAQSAAAPSPETPPAQVQ